MVDAIMGDYLAVTTAGAFELSLPSSYNSRPRAAEILVESAVFRVFRALETYADSIRGETQ
jgi:diaminopimelate decarboxylase